MRHGVRDTETVQIALGEGEEDEEPGSGELSHGEGGETSRPEVRRFQRANVSIMDIYTPTGEGAQVVVSASRLG
jgi:hypothetical protein